MEGEAEAEAEAVEAALKSTASTSLLLTHLHQTRQQQGQIDDTTVLDGWAGTVMQKTTHISSVTNPRLNN